MKWLKFLALIVIFIVTTSLLVFIILGYLDVELTHISENKRNEYLKLAIEGTEWMLQFQITPPFYNWGWHTPCKGAWGGLAGYYTRAFKWAAAYGAESEHIVYVASHDTGWLLEILTKLYKITGKRKYLEAAKLAADWCLRLQVGRSEWIKKFSNFYIKISKEDRRVIWNYASGLKLPNGTTGAFTEGMFFFSGLPPKFGEWSSGTNFAEPATWIAPEHVNPIVSGLLELYEITKEKRYLEASKVAINWLLMMQSREGGIYTSYPPEIYGIRMSDTAATALTLFKAYDVTGNKTYLFAAIKCADFMLEYQNVMKGDFACGGIVHLSKAGGEWRQHSYFAGDAIAAILVWIEAYKRTNDTKYLCGELGTFEEPKGGALLAAEFVLRMQVTPFYYAWGSHSYSLDRGAIGGIYWVYIPSYGILPYQFTSTASYAIRALLTLYKELPQYISKRGIFKRAAELAYHWLTKTNIYAPSNRLNKLPGLIYVGDRHGLYKVGYVPSYKKYYDEIPGTMCGDPRQGFTVAMSVSGPVFAYLFLYEYSIAKAHSSTDHLRAIFLIKSPT